MDKDQSKDDVDGNAGAKKGRGGSISKTERSKRLKAERLLKESTRVKRTLTRQQGTADLLKTDMTQISSIRTRYRQATGFKTSIPGCKPMEATLHFEKLFSASVPMKTIPQQLVNLSVKELGPTVIVDKIDHWYLCLLQHMNMLPEERNSFILEHVKSFNRAEKDWIASGIVHCAQEARRQVCVDPQTGSPIVTTLQSVFPVFLKIWKEYLIQPNLRGPLLEPLSWKLFANPLAASVKFLTENAQPFSSFKGLPHRSVWGKLELIKNSNGDLKHQILYNEDMQSLAPTSWYTNNIVDCILLGLEKGVMEELAAPLGNLSNQRNAVSILPFDMASPAIMSIRDDLNKPEVVTTLEEVKNWLTTPYREPCENMVIPFCWTARQHFVLLVANKTTHKISVFDPKKVGGIINTTSVELMDFIKGVESVLEWCLHEPGLWSKDATGGLHTSYRVIDASKDIVLQTDGHSCGPLCCTYIEFMTNKRDVMSVKSRKQDLQGRIDLVRLRHYNILRKLKIDHVPSKAEVLATEVSVKRDIVNTISLKYNKLIHQLELNPMDDDLSETVDDCKNELELANLVLNQTIRKRDNALVVAKDKAKNSFLVDTVLLAVPHPASPQPPSPVTAQLTSPIPSFDYQDMFPDYFSQVQLMNQPNSDVIDTGMGFAQNLKTYTEVNLTESTAGRTTPDLFFGGKLDSFYSTATDSVDPGADVISTNSNLVPENVVITPNQNLLATPKRNSDFVYNKRTPVTTSVEPPSSTVRGSDLSSPIPDTARGLLSTPGKEIANTKSPNTKEDTVMEPSSLSPSNPIFSPVASNDFVYENKTPDVAIVQPASQSFSPDRGTDESSPVGDKQRDLPMTPGKNLFVTSPNAMDSSSSSPSKPLFPSILSFEEDIEIEMPPTPGRNIDFSKLVVPVGVAEQHSSSLTPSNAWSNQSNQWVKVHDLVHSIIKSCTSTSEGPISRAIRANMDSCNAICKELGVRIDWDKSISLKSVMLDPLTNMDEHASPSRTNILNNLRQEEEKYTEQQTRRLSGGNDGEVPDSASEQQVLDILGDTPLHASENPPPLENAQNLTLERIEQLCNDYSSVFIATFQPHGFLEQNIAYYDLLRLKGAQFLNDTIIDAKMAAIQHECALTSSKRLNFVYIPTLEARTVFKKEGNVFKYYNDSEKRIVEALEKLNSGLRVLVPVYLNENHWCIIFINPLDHTIAAYDPFKHGLHTLSPCPSLFSKMRMIRKLVCATLKHDISMWSEGAVDVLGWPKQQYHIQFDRLGVQEDGHSCGIFICMAAEIWSGSLDVDYDSAALLCTKGDSKEAKKKRRTGEKAIRETILHDILGFITKDPAYLN